MTYSDDCEFCKFDGDDECAFGCKKEVFTGNYKEALRIAEGMYQTALNLYRISGDPYQVIELLDTAWDYALEAKNVFWDEAGVLIEKIRNLKEQLGD